jgi:hypothetical protein
MKCSLSSRKESVVFTSITLLIELFVNCSELKVMQCSMTKSVPKFGLQKWSIGTKDMKTLFRQMNMILFERYL